MRAQPRRQLLLDKAASLFNQHGYHATGIDRILKESGVSKATLYKYFASKDALILEVLKQRHVQLKQSLIDHFTNAPIKEESVLIIFDNFNDWFNSENFYGCNFINAGAEFAQDDSEIHQYSTYHKESLKQLLKEFLIKTKRNKEESVAIADSLILLLDGAIIGAQIRGDMQSALKAKAIAAKLLKN